MERYDHVNGESFVEVLKEQIIEMSSNFDDLLKVCQEQKQEIEQLKEQSERYRLYWSSSQTTIVELRKDLFDMRRELDLAELQLKVMQLEESNARLRESLDEVR